MSILETARQLLACGVRALHLVLVPTDTLIPHVGNNSFPMSETNSIFVYTSPDSDTRRASFYSFLMEPAAGSSESSLFRRRTGMLLDIQVRRLYHIQCVARNMFSICTMNGIKSWYPDTFTL